MKFINEVVFCNGMKGDLTSATADEGYDTFQIVADALLMGERVPVVLPDMPEGIHALQVTCYHVPTNVKPTDQLDMLLRVYRACDHIFDAIENRTEKGDIIVPAQRLIIPKGVKAA